MAKIAMCADVHLGVSGRLADIIWSLRVIREYCKVANVDTVIVLGDLFHDRRSIDIDVLSESVKFFEQTAALGQHWIAFPGNHDMYLRHSWQVNSLAALRKHLTVIEDVKLLTVDDARFWIVPFITYEKPFMRVVHRIEKQHQDGDALLTHIGVRGSTLNTCFLLKDWSTITFEYSKFDRVYTGHFHSKQQVGNNVWYPGSPIPFKFDEGDVPHGFLVYDTATREHKFINIWKAGAKFFPDEPMPPQYHTITDEVIDQLTADDISNSMVRLSLLKQHTSDEIKQMKEHILKLGAKAVRIMDCTQKIETNYVIAQKPASNLFQSWIDQDKNGLKGLDVKILQRINDEIIREGDEKYTIEESE